MKSIMPNLFLVICLLWIPSMVQIKAQEGERTWDISFTVSPYLWPVLATNTSGNSIGRGWKAYSIVGEYYLPKKWSIEAGYFHTEVKYGKNSRTMKGLQFGIKRYIIKHSFFIQPYIMAGTQYNWGGILETHSIINGNYLNAQFTRNPKLSFVPGLGADIFLLNSVAFIIKYNFNMGFNSKTVIDAMPENKNPYFIKDRGFFHNLEVGIKITFPFPFQEI